MSLTWIWVRLAVGSLICSDKGSDASPFGAAAACAKHRAGCLIETSSATAIIHRSRRLCADLLAGGAVKVIGPPFMGSPEAPQEVRVRRCDDRLDANVAL